MRAPTEYENLRFEELTIAGIKEPDSTKRGAPNIKGPSTRFRVNTPS
jgi:hypothetical protein